MNENKKVIPLSTFIITIISILIVFTITLLSVIFYYENKLANQETDLTLIPNIYNDDINSIEDEESITLIE